jgi:hypothetical protein
MVFEINVLSQFSQYGASNNSWTQTHDLRMMKNCASIVLLLFVTICIKLNILEIACNDPEIGECFLKSTYFWHFFSTGDRQTDREIDRQSKSN